MVSKAYHKYFYVNLSASIIPVYDLITNERIGSLNQGESFSYAPTEYPLVYFLASDGAGRQGKIADSAIKNATRWSELPYKAVNGLKMFRARYDMPIYNPSGKEKAIVKAGGYVQTNGCQSGDTHYDWLLIDQYKNSDSDSWKTIDGSYGFVDTGLISWGSGRNYIGIYGSWAL